MKKGKLNSTDDHPVGNVLLMRLHLARGRGVRDRCSSVNLVGQPGKAADFILGFDLGPGRLVGGAGGLVFRLGDDLPLQELLRPLEGGVRHLVGGLGGPELAQRGRRQQCGEPHRHRCG